MHHLSNAAIQLQSAKCARFLTSKDGCVRSLATKKATNNFHPKRFSCFRKGLKSLQNHPLSLSRSLAQKTKFNLKEDQQQQLLNKLNSRKIQGCTSRLNNSAPDMWANCVRHLPSSQLSFIMNATNETLPSNANLVLWKKRTCDKCPLCQRRQAILHVLNNCEVLVRNEHYNTRHDAILHLLLKEAIKYLPQCSTFMPTTRIVHSFPYWYSYYCHNVLILLYGGRIPLKFILSS